MTYTSIEGRVVREIGPDVFSDIADAPLVVPEGISRRGLLFGGDLSADQVAAIWARMESTDDADQVRRADLRADRDALAADDPLRRLYDYVLGDA